MIKNATIYKIPPFAFEGLSHALSCMTFAPTLPTQEKSVGWVPPRGEEHGALVEGISGALVFRLKVETRKVPAATLADELAKACKHIEATTGRKPGKKEKRDLKEELVLGLLPKAFPAQKVATCIADGDRLIIDATSASLLDDVLTALVRCADGSAAEPLCTNTSPTVAMATWLTEQEAPAGFAIGKECELKSVDESQAKVRYSHHALLTDEVKAHLAQGKQPTRLELEWDDRVSFVLGDNLQLKKLDFSDDVLNQVTENGLNPADFDGSMAIAIGELRALIPDLLGALDGVADKKGAA